ncbi:NADH-dependent phenylglyoxylate dehydrogenase subunit epsilon [Neomoorella glycerini]|uniref:NADH-dependent phenylglyoxylate dehydrogenase subunit epsilon n=1 Tax=Neomoorella glycerini TaxID=55779 RepID=A0A6I5ZRW9_9FIRM|nr:FAD-dependent oxidoreductase [Moorella glycerini]QGP92763.1 NADH-dependent phenylglyoxylate dehydrogenase subunit epsilon [Moorella glycerini]
MYYLIIGNSAAGVAAARAIRRTDPGGNITIVGDEPYTYYARVLTSYYLGGLIPREKLWLAGEEWYREQGIRLIPGRRAVAVDPGGSRVMLADGSELPYDRLLVATGAAPQQIDVPGSNLAGVFTLRTLDDAAAIRKFARPGGQAVVVGGGLVGIKAAEGLHARGLKVRLVVSSGRLLSQALDDTGAELVRRAMGAAGFTVHLREDVIALEGREKVTAAVLRSGAVVPADVVVVGKGVRPNVDFLQGSGIEVDRGILVDDYLATSIPGIYAAGDVVQAYDRAWQYRRLNAVWGNAVEQGRLAGFNMAGHHTSYRGGIGQNSLVVSGLGVISGGIVNPPGEKESRPAGGRMEQAGNGSAAYPPGEGYQVLTRLDEKHSYYRKAVLQGRRLVGMVAVGPPEGAGSFQSLIGREVKEKYIASFLDGSFTWAMVGR